MAKCLGETVACRSHDMGACSTLQSETAVHIETREENQSKASV